MKEKINELISTFSGDVALFAHNLTTGTIINIKGEEASRCASEAKLYILLAYAEQVALGDLEPSRRVPVNEEDITPGSGVLRFATQGLNPTASFLAYLMMTVSDNTATNMLLDIVGGVERVNALLSRLEITNTVLDGKIWTGGWVSSSAADLAKACAVIAEPEKYKFPSQGAEHCKEIMARHFENNGIVRFLPWSPFAEDMKAHKAYQNIIANYAGIEYYGKAGYTPGYRGDAALFISQKNKYVIGLKCANIPGEKPLNAANEGFSFSAAVGKLFYDYWALA